MMGSIWVAPQERWSDKYQRYIRAAFTDRDTHDDVAMHVENRWHAEEYVPAAKLAAHRDLAEALSEFAYQHYCGCGHPACNDCARDRIARAALHKAGLPAPGDET